MATPKITKKSPAISRRQLLLGGALAIPPLALGLNRLSDNGGPHSEYFLQLQHALQAERLSKPTLVIDRDRLRHNCGRLRVHLPADMQYRIVAKSLPCDGLLKEVMAATGSRALMVFHQPFLNHVDEQYPQSDLLLGKPMPAAAAQQFFVERKSGSGDTPNIQWLVDSNERLTEYAAIASQRGPMRINLEIDVGLHRGGFSDQKQLAKAITTLRDNPLLTFSGFMGYEPHIPKMPGLLGGADNALKQAKAQYQACIDTAKSVLGDQYDDRLLTLNTGGSPTFQLYENAGPANELAMGSGLVKPSDFDLETLADHVPATFIATPVLKKLRGTTLPGMEALSGVMRLLDSSKAQTFFTYGGYWKASTVSPPGLETNAIFGRSTNQEMLNGSNNVELNVNDTIFLRPHQSEHVFLQFGDAAVYSQGKIVDRWPVFQQGA